MPQISVDTDYVVELSGLSNSVTDAVISDATVGVTVLDAAGAALTGTTWPIVLSPIALSPGTYRGTLPDSISVVVGDWVKIEVAADAGAGLARKWYQQVQVVEGPFAIRRDRPL